MTTTTRKPTDATLIAPATVCVNIQARGSVVENGPEKAGPRAGTTSMSEYDTDSDNDDVECPTCGELFPSPTRVGMHHSREHGETLKEYRKRQGEHKCPWDGCDDGFSTVKGMKTHHKHAHGESIMGIEAECAWCGETKKVRPCRVENFDKKFCDKECEGKWVSENQMGEENPFWKGGLLEKKCSNCGDVFQAYPSDENRRYCSHKCFSSQNTGKDHHSWQGGKVELECEQCGGEYRVDPYREGASRFCSEKCFGEWLTGRYTGEDHPNWTGGYRKTPFGKEWYGDSGHRERALERDSYQCQICGMATNITGSSSAEASMSITSARADVLWRMGYMTINEETRSTTSLRCVGTATHVGKASRFAPRSTCHESTVF